MWCRQCVPHIAVYTGKTSVQIAVNCIEPRYWTNLGCWLSSVLSCIKTCVDSAFPLCVVHSVVTQTYLLPRSSRRPEKIIFINPALALTNSNHCCHLLLIKAIKIQISTSSGVLWSISKSVTHALINYIRCRNNVHMTCKWIIINPDFRPSMSVW